MTLAQIALCNLKRRKAKSAFVLFGLFIAVTAVVAFLSLVESLTLDINDKLDQYGANILIAPRTETLALTYGGLSLGGLSFDVREISQKELDRVRTIENSRNIAAVGPMVLGPVEIGGERVLLAGIEMATSRVLRPWWTVRGELPAGEGVLAGAEAARVLALNTGARISLGGSEMPVTGILESTGSQDDQMVFMPLAAAQRLLGKEGRVTMAEIAALCSDCPIEEIVRQVSAVLPNARVMPIRQVVEGRMEAIQHLRRFGYALAFLVATAGGLVVLVTMMGSVRERTSEIGIMRAVGFRSGHVARIVLLEAGIISAVAGVLGYLVGVVATRLAIPLFTESRQVTVVSDPLIAGGAIALAILLGLGSSLYPALLAARLDPADALRAL